MTQPSPTTRTYEDGVRDCIEALPKAYLQNPHAACSGPVRLAHEAARAALETLLPDPAEELARDWREHDTWAGGFDTPLRRETAERFARYLINQGKVRP